MGTPALDDPLNRIRMGTLREFGGDSLTRCFQLRGNSAGTAAWHAFVAGLPEPRGLCFATDGSVRLTRPR